MQCMQYLLAPLQKKRPQGQFARTYLHCIVALSNIIYNIPNNTKNQPARWRRVPFKFEERSSSISFN